jgi:hypothetical protein
VIAPAIVLQPTNQTVAVGQSATFSIQASGSNLDYQWQRNGVNIVGALSPSYTVAASALDNSAAFRCAVSNSQGQVVSQAATLTVTGIAESARNGSGEIIAVPNPLVLHNGVHRIVFTNAASVTDVKIYSRRGALVTELSRPEWDATDARGHTVTSGVYTALLSGAGVQTKIKIAIVK